MRADRSTSSSFSTSSAATAAAAATAMKKAGDYAPQHISAHLSSIGVAGGGAAGNRNSTGSTSSGSQASSGFESAKTSNCSVSNLVNSNSSSSCSTAASSSCAAGAPVAQPSSASAQQTHFASAQANATGGLTNFGLESPSASSRISTSSGGGSTASRCSTYYGSMDYYDTLSGLNLSAGGCSTTAGPSCASSGILSDASSTATISPSASSGGGAARSAAPQYRKGRNGGGSGRVNIKDMMHRGIAEPEILAEWLQRLCLSPYLSQFITHGYDLVSISRITPEDLTALGISRPEDRKRLIQDIQHWQLADGWPTHFSADASVREFLGALGLVQYIELFESQGYTTVHEVENLTWEDLEDIGVKKLGHMKRICLALKKLKTSKNTAANSAHQRMTSPSSQRDFVNVVQYAESDENFQHPTTVDAGSQAAYATIHRRNRPQQQQQQQTYQQDRGNIELANQQNPQVQYLSRMSMPFATNGAHAIVVAAPGHNKQRPVVTVLPNNQTPAQSPASSVNGGELAYDDDGACNGNSGGAKKTTVVYKNDSFGADASALGDAPPKQQAPKPKRSLKLNLFRTSQILSDFGELPKSLDGEPLNPLHSTRSAAAAAAAKYASPPLSIAPMTLDFEEGGADEIYSARSPPPPPPPAPLPYASTTSANFHDSSSLRVNNNNNNNKNNGMLRSRRTPTHSLTAVAMPTPAQNGVQAQYATLASTFAVAASQSQSQPSTPRNLQRFVERGGAQMYANEQERANTMDLAEPMAAGTFGANLRRQFYSDESFGEIDHILRDLSHQVEAMPGGPAHHHHQLQQQQQAHRQQIQQQQQQHNQQARQIEQQQIHYQQQMRRRQQQQQELHRKQHESSGMVSTKR